MANCARCGTSLGDYGHAGMCSSCNSLADAENVQCQRCGMYLPSHELRMQNSRLYCAYCTMDVQDEEARQKKSLERPAPIEQPQASKTRPEETRPISYPAEVQQPSSGPAVEQYSTNGGICERCGASAPRLYLYKRRKMCVSCVKEEGGSIEPAKSFFHKLHEIVAGFLLFKNKKKN